jgi:hypothetical protein
LRREAGALPGPEQEFFRTIKPAESPRKAFDENLIVDVPMPAA